MTIYSTHLASRAPETSLRIDGSDLSIADLSRAARGVTTIEFACDEACRTRIDTAASLVEQAAQNGRPLYGVNTGFGAMADVVVPASQAAAAQENLLKFLAAGAGPTLDNQHVRGAMALRASVLSRGCSGVRFELIERLVRFLQADALPVVRRLGSIGASGDLVPLSTIARAITKRDNRVVVRLNGHEQSAASALDHLGLPDLVLRPKEGLALVNGTSFSASIAANCVAEMRELLSLALAINAMMLVALDAQHEPFEAFVHNCKPHPGQVRAAKILRRLLQRQPNANGSSNNGHRERRSQDRYSIRCLPQYYGSLIDGLSSAASIVETEMNGISDNPLVDVDQERFYQSGNFLGQYIAVAMDGFRRDAGLLAKHLDVQIALLVTPEFSHGLPGSLVGNSSVPFNMGLKGLQITANSIMPMLTHLGNPLATHYPTHAEQFNQNINGLSWGSANLAWDAVELLRAYLSTALVFAVQAVDLRTYATLHHYDARACLGTELEQLYESAYLTLGADPGGRVPLVYDDEDACLEDMLEALTAGIRDHGRIIDAVAPVKSSMLDE